MPFPFCEKSKQFTVKYGSTTQNQRMDQTPTSNRLRLIVSGQDRHTIEKKTSKAKKFFYNNLKGFHLTCTKKKKYVASLKIPPNTSLMVYPKKKKKNGRFVDHPTFLLSQIDCDLLCMIFDSLSLKKLKLERESYFHHSFESHFQ